MNYSFQALPFFWLEYNYNNNNNYTQHLSEWNFSQNDFFPLDLYCALPNDRRQFALFLVSPHSLCFFLLEINFQTSHFFPALLNNHTTFAVAVVFVVLVAEINSRLILRFAVN